MLLFSLAAIIGSGANCGAGEESNVDPGVIETSSITKRQFIQRADEICDLGNRWLLKQIDAYITERKGARSKQGDSEFFTEAAKALVLPRVEANIRDIQALGAPQGDETELEAFLTQMQQETSSLQNQAEISMSQLFEGSYNNAGELARDYGLTACAYG